MKCYVGNIFLPFDFLMSHLFIPRQTQRSMYGPRSRQELSSLRHDPTVVRERDQRRSAQHQEIVDEGRQDGGPTEKGEPIDRHLLMTTRVAENTAGLHALTRRQIKKLGQLKRISRPVQKFEFEEDDPKPRAPRPESPPGLVVHKGGPFCPKLRFMTERFDHLTKTQDPVTEKWGGRVSEGHYHACNGNKFGRAIETMNRELLGEEESWQICRFSECIPRIDEGGEGAPPFFPQGMCPW